MEHSPVTTIYNLDELCLALIVSKLDYVSAQTAKCAWSRFNYGDGKKPDTVAICVKLIVTGELHALKVIHAGGRFILTARMMNLAASHGRLEMLQWMHSIGGELTKHVMAYAASASLSCVKWLLDVGCPLTKTAVPFAGSSKDPEVIRLLYERMPSLDLRKCCDIALNEGNFETFKCTHELGCHFEDDMFKYACTSGSLPCMKYLRKHGARPGKDAAPFAARTGRLDVLKWIHKHGAPLSGEVMTYAQMSGNIEMIAWLRSLRCPWHTDEGCNAAAAGVRVLKWVHENGGPVGPNAWSGAISFDRVDCLYYLRAIGVPLPEFAVCIAIEKSAMESLRMLVQYMDGEIQPWMLKWVKFDCTTECFAYAWETMGVAVTNTISTSDCIRHLVHTCHGVKSLKFLLATKRKVDFCDAMDIALGAHKNCERSPYVPKGTCEKDEFDRHVNHRKFMKLLQADCRSRQEREQMENEEAKLMAMEDVRV